MTLNQAPMNTTLTISSSTYQESENISDIASRLMHLGFIDGEKIKVTRKAPLFREPLLVEVRGRSIALSFAEAELVQVKVV